MLILMTNNNVNFGHKVKYSPEAKAEFARQMDKWVEFTTKPDIKMNGKNSNADVSSKSVARKESYQRFNSNVEGNTKCFAHVSCDAIVMEKSRVTSTPSIIANSKEAEMSHEAVIGKIATDQITKLMTLGLTESEAEEKILEGFLK